MKDRRWSCFTEPLASYELPLKKDVEIRVKESSNSENQENEAEGQSWRRGGEDGSDRRLE